jgi:hypothetical protein
MFKGSTLVIVGLSLMLLLSATALAQGQGKVAASKRKAAAGRKHNNDKAARYANQEVSYRQRSTGANSGKLPSATATQPGLQQKPKPKQQNLLPYIEQDNLRRRQTRKR